MSNHGSFSGNPKTEWLVDESATNGDEMDAVIERHQRFDGSAMSPGGARS